MFNIDDDAKSTEYFYVFTFDSLSTSIQNIITLPIEVYFYYKNGILETSGRQTKVSEKVVDSLIKEVLKIYPGRYLRMVLAL